MTSVLAHFVPESFPSLHHSHIQVVGVLTPQLWAEIEWGQAALRLLQTRLRSVLFIGICNLLPAWSGSLLL